jgi:hypothetical protein
MIKWFVYLVFLLVFTPYLLSAKAYHRQEEIHTLAARLTVNLPAGPGKPLADTIKTVKITTKGEIKEVPSAKRQPKPEKVDNNGQPAVKKERPKRERRPDGMERPPEIPRRNDN